MCKDKPKVYWDGHAWIVHSDFPPYEDCYDRRFYGSKYWAVALEWANTIARARNKNA